MKKKILLLALAVSVLLVFSCSKKEDAKSASEGTSENGGSRVAWEVPSEDNQPINQSMNYGFVLVVNSGFYTLSGEDTKDETTKVRWSAQMSLGERVFTGETRRMIFETENRVYSFIEISRDDGVNGYALATHVAVGGQIAVVVDDRANLFRTPRSVDVTGTILTRRTVVICYPETERDGFVEVRGYDQERRVFISPNISNVRVSALSRRDSDIQSAILLTTALSLRDNERARREALLEMAMSDFPDSIFRAEINEIVNPPPPVVTEPDPPPVQPITETAEED
ncbi:MAG: hypothetical protein FWD13_10105 [Treponema sp.]|nr:hypothetical protein [Treponema sp.]